MIKNLPFKTCVALAAILCMLLFKQCTKEAGSVNISFRNKSLQLVQSYVSGKWILNYAYGGIAAIKYPAKHHAYLNLTDSHITIGNDSAGVIVDTVASWRKEPDGPNNSITLVSYFYAPGYGFAYNYVVDEIKNDTLIMHEYTSDALYYYYTRW